MTTPLKAPEVTQEIARHFPEAIVEVEEKAILVQSSTLLQVAQFLKTTPGLDFDYLTYVTAIDYLDYFEVVYHLVSMEHNHSLVLKTRCYDRESPVLPSVVSLWRGADFQEREIYDLMGIRFEGHPNLKPIVLWEGFEEHPLRKDYW